MKIELGLTPAESSRRQNGSKEVKANQDILIYIGMYILVGL